jgi:hypothetical protein
VAVLNLRIVNIYPGLGTTLPYLPMVHLLSRRADVYQVEVPEESLDHLIGLSDAEGLELIHPLCSNKESHLVVTIEPLPSYRLS